MPPRCCGHSGRWSACWCGSTMQRCMVTALSGGGRSGGGSSYADWEVLQAELLGGAVPSTCEMLKPLPVPKPNSISGTKVTPLTKAQPYSRRSIRQRLDQHHRNI